MIDRFRFRAWLKDRKKYDYDIEDCFEDWIFENFGQYLKDEDVIVEQCTGAKDKNGKLIYEGDIVREISKKEPEWEEYIITVEWKGCGFNLYRDDEFDFLVIGNIHENADLLENEE